MNAAYYNEIDPFAAQWLRNLIAAGHIAPGEVDERSIEDIQPDELRGFTQAHFFAGIGIWSGGLRAKGWADDRPIWTGSCPCQPFSAAGKGDGFADERHLWPAFFHLIGECRPPEVIGEQVASKDGLAWLELVQTDLEASGYAFGAFDLSAAGFASPEITGRMGGAHIRQRTYWGARRLGDSDNAGSQGRNGGSLQERAGECPAGAPSTPGRLANAVSARRSEGWPESGCGQVAGGGSTSWVADTHRARRIEGGGNDSPLGHREAAAADCEPRGLADAHKQGGGGRGVQGPGEGTEAGFGSSRERSEGFCQDHVIEWLPCRDGKWRPVESGTFPLAHEDTGRVGKLRAFGNALDKATAEAFIEAWMECAP